jgi:hypothetical protein
MPMDVDQRNCIIVGVKVRIGYETLQQPITAVIPISVFTRICRRGSSQRQYPKRKRKRASKIRMRGKKSKFSRVIKGEMLWSA